MTTPRNDERNRDRNYWDRHAGHYDWSMRLLGRPIPRMVELAGEATRGLERRLRATGATNVRCERADLHALRFGDGAFDAVVAANVLHLVPTYCHDETARSWILSRAIALTGFPGHRRFTSRSLRQVVEAAGVRVTRSETLPGIIPVGYVEGVFEP